MNQQPEKKFKAGAVSATVWKNHSEKGDYNSIQLDRVYKDKDGWKRTSSFSAQDLPKAMLVLHKAYEFIVSKDKDDQTQNQTQKSSAFD